MDDAQLVADWVGENRGAIAAIVVVFSRSAPLVVHARYGLWVKPGALSDLGVSRAPFDQA